MALQGVKGLGEKPLTIRVYDLGEFDEKMLKKALKVIGDEEELVVMGSCVENTNKSCRER